MCQSYNLDVLDVTSSCKTTQLNDRANLRVLQVDYDQAALKPITVEMPIEVPSTNCDANASARRAGDARGVHDRRLLQVGPQGQVLKLM